MNKSDIQKIVFNAIEMTNNSREEDAQVPVTETAELFGSDGHLDSMGLVVLLLDIEESFLDADIEIVLSDERAMSQSKSPFRNVGALVDYIETLVKESS